MSKNSTHPKVSVVIPHYGGKDIISECLSSLLNSIYPNFEIIVIDNNSPDDSVQYIKNNFSQVRLIKSSFNRGFAGGCNLGVNHAEGKYILILNNDTIHEPDWINRLVEVLESNSLISSVQPKIKNYNKRNYFDYAGASGGFLDKYCFPFSRGRIFSTIEQDIGQYDTPIKIFWASGTAFLTRKTIFNQINGFDEKLFAHMEEIDFHWKCQLLGYEIWVEPNSVIYHKGAMTLSKSSPKKTYLNYRNSMILLLTNYPIIRSVKLFFPRLILELIACIKELINLNFSHSFAIVKSWVWILFNFNILIHRRRFFKNKDIKQINMIFNKSIVVKYFINKQKFFSNISQYISNY